MNEALVQRVPPSDIDTEKAVLGCMLLEGEAAGLAIDILTADDFFRSTHRVIFRVLSDICARGDLPDELLLVDALQAGDNLELIGGADYLHELVGVVPSAANIENYAEIVKNLAVRRKVIEAAAKQSRDAETGDGIAAAEKGMVQLREILEVGSGMEITSIGTELEEIISNLEKLGNAPTDVTGIATGLPYFDKTLTGLHDGEFIIIAARPSVGKTALAVTMLANMTCKVHAVPALLFSLEMPRRDITKRLLSQRSKIPYQALRTGYGISGKWDEIMETAASLEYAPLYIDDTSSPTVQQIRAATKAYQAKRHIKIVFLDYLQLITPPKGQTREREVAQIAAALKAMARDFSIPVVALSQLRRPIQGKENSPPTLSDLRDSGALEQDADVVVFIHRNRMDTGMLELQGMLAIAKQRNGECCNIHFDLQGPYMRVVERAYGGGGI